MKYIIKGTIIAALLTGSSFVTAQWSAGVGYASYDELGFGVIYGSGGYEYESGSFSFMPELRLGTGITDANLPNRAVVGDFNKFEIDSFVSLSFRGQYNLTESFGAFLQPAYRRVKTTASGNDGSVSGDQWKAKVGIGAAYKISENFALEAVYEKMLKDNVISVAVRYRF